MTKRFLVQGHVQGVGFRYFTRQEALKLNIRGWVRNCPDGSVECLAQADSETLAGFEKKLSRGPALAKVTGIESTDVNEEVSSGSFEIVR